ncbi:NifU-like N terminal domain-containing protein [Hyaloraphidium curvatum]|nr:NifU-like N terminal domain-containing protein [Hyaloraphidium curvatum]
MNAFSAAASRCTAAAARRGASASPAAAACQYSTCLSRRAPAPSATCLKRPFEPSARAPTAVAPQKRAYHEKVIDHYERPRNVGSLPKDDPNVGTGLVGAPACGDVMKLQIYVDEVTGEIRDVKFKTFGCGSAIASSSLVTERIKGLRLHEAAAIKNTDIAKELKLPPVKLHCSMLAEDAIKSAIKDYESKKSRRSPSLSTASSPPKQAEAAL